MESPEAPSRAYSGGKAGPKSSGLLRNVSVHTQITEAELEEHHNHHRPQLRHLYNGQKDFAKVMPEF